MSHSLRRSFRVGVACANLAFASAFAIGSGCRAEDRRPHSPAASAGREGPSTRPGAAAAPAGAEATTRTRGPSTRDRVDADGVVRRGKPLGKVDPISVESAVARAESLDGTTVTLQGRVDRVCRKKGCWMVIASDDGEETIRVTFEDYAFFVPRESPGLQAVVRGRLAVKTIDVETARHFEDERVEGTGEAPKKITTPQREVSVVASGLELREG